MTNLVLALAVLACVVVDQTYGFLNGTKTKEEEDAYITEQIREMMLLYGATQKVQEDTVQALLYQNLVFHHIDQWMTVPRILVGFFGYPDLTTTPFVPPSPVTAAPIITINVDLLKTTTTQTTTTFAPITTAPTTPSPQQLAASRAVYEASSIAVWLSQATTPVPTVPTVTTASTTPPPSTPELVVPTYMRDSAFDVGIIGVSPAPIPQPMIARSVPGSHAIHYRLLDPSMMATTTITTIRTPSIQPTVAQVTTETVDQQPQQYHWLDPAGFAQEVSKCKNSNEFLTCAKGPFAFALILSVSCILLVVIGVGLYKFIKKRYYSAGTM
ncbi:membrane protein ORF131 [Cyprinid herpesvirus 2]|uniref:Membrane protein ORF131 n=1 Tax=Cyprinid herpesvirus 2 TaxID=317878 RepID=K7PC16_CYHV2|nr:membrane protein ORF131 [Cyprinid herpesvirus 2]AFJ20558.1 membrane protein ORF131 [Cyprinid herpesvirus 2]